VFNIFACLAEFERDLIRERTQAGLKAARARVRTGGSPKGLSEKAERKAIAAEALKEGQLSVAEICQNWTVPSVQHLSLQMLFKDGFVLFGKRISCCFDFNISSDRNSS